MLNKDKRSLIFSLLLGDGCLHTLKNKYTAITIDHGLAQADYQSWKAKLLTDVFGREVKVRTGHKGKSLQISICDNRMRAWRKFTHTDNKKDLSKIIKYIRHPEMALAIWLMDDGYVEPSFSKLATGEKKNYGARFRIFTCDQTEGVQLELIQWFKKIFNIEPTVKYSFKRSANKHYPFLKINQKDSLIIWEKIREFILQFKSMQYKFRHIEQIYQSRVVQRIPGQNPDDIVHPCSDTEKVTSTFK